jgi:hypothetical protein
MATRFKESDAATASRRAGGRAKGEFRCSECGYGVVISKVLPSCPMCHGDTWESAPWRPFTRAASPPPDRELDDVWDLPL